MLKIKNKTKLAVALSIVIAIIVCTSIVVMVLLQNKPEKEVQVSALDSELMQEEGMQNVEEIVTEENVQENYEEEAIEQEQQLEETPNENKMATNANKKTNTQTTTTQTSNTPYYIRINYEQNVVTIYGKDESGDYTKPIKAMVCSCGKATPKSGTYSISSKYKWGKLYGGVSGQYCTRIVKSILFHSVPYVTHEDASSLEYWEYDKLGTTASAGCVRLTVADAQWIYNNCAKGTKVEFYADANPGPLGKPTAQKISSEEAVRGWDPTDPAPENPWKTYNKKEEAIKVENEVVNNVVEPENTVEQNEIVNNVEKPENTVTQNEVVNNVVIPENTVIQNEVVNNVVIPENMVIQNEVVNNVEKPDNTVIQNEVVNNVVNQENTATQNEIVNNVIKPENNIIQNEVTNIINQNNIMIQNEIIENIINTI